MTSISEVLQRLLTRDVVMETAYKEISRVEETRKAGIIEKMRYNNVRIHLLIMHIFEKSKNNLVLKV